MNLHFILVLFTLLSTQSNATSFYIRPFSEFTQSSTNIVRGTMSDIHAANQLTPDGMKAIYTYATLDVKEVLKGDIQKHLITIRKIGGTVDGYTVEIPSSPEFKEGDDTVLFLSAQHEDASYEVTGLELGKFALEEKNGETLLKGGIFNYSKSGSSEEEHSQYAKNTEENHKVWSLKDLRALIQKQSPSAAATPPTAPKNLTTPPTRVIASTVNRIPSANNSESSTERQSSPETAPENSFFLYGFCAILLAGIAFFFLKKKIK